MEITVEQVQGTNPVTIFYLHGELDASNFQDLIQKAAHEFRSGCRYLLLDMSDTPFMSSSGIVALHNITTLFNGNQPTNTDEGWEAIHAVGRQNSDTPQPHVKLLSPSPRVLRTLEKTGLNLFFEIYTDRQQALTSFQPA